MLSDGHTASNLTAEHRAFCLGEALVEIETCAINNWCGCDEDDLSIWSAGEELPEFLTGRFGDAEILIQRLSGTLPPNQRSKLRLNALTAMRIALQHFRTEFRSDFRREKVQQVLKADPNAGGDVNAFMFHKSPFESRQWSQMYKSVLRFVRNLPARTASCFRIAERLQRERWQATSRVQAARLDINRERYLTSLFVPRLTRMVRDLAAGLPTLAELDCNFSYGAFFADASDDARGGYVQWLKKKLTRLRDYVESTIRAAK